MLKGVECVEPMIVDCFCRLRVAYIVDRPGRPAGQQCLSKVCTANAGVGVVTDS